MSTTIDEGKGLVKVYWADIRHRVAKVAPQFAKIIDKISPDHTFPIYLAYYPYGEIICDTKQLFLPKQSGGVYSLSEPEAPKEVIKHLGYGKNSIPFGIVLDKTMEYFIDFKDEPISIPWLLYSPGTFFPITRILSSESKYVYASNNILTTVSGARSAFMLPNIGCAVHHTNLQREFNLQIPPPKNLYQQGEVFKQLANSKLINSPWRSCLMYFSEKWIQKLHTDSAWLELKLYLHETGWQRTEYNRNSISYAIAFSVIQKKRNLKPNPYLTDTSRHLFATALGAAAGYVPAMDESALPLNILQKIYIESYGLKKYFPTILQPHMFNFEIDKLPIYYSLQYPSTYIFSPKSRKITNTLLELRELEHITKVFANELSKSTALCADTIIHEVAKKIEFNYFHNEVDSHHIIKPSTEIFEFDDRFKKITADIKLPHANFSSDARFLRGCISISVK
jgi:hypothetical protein